MKTKVRFHLARGENYMRWQVKNGSEVKYYDPEDVMLEMQNATLRNSRKAAERIYSGANKSVCAWVECEDLSVKPATPNVHPEVKDFAQYNPKRRPFWHDTKRNNLDNKKYQRLSTYGKLIIISQ
tara:strand:- start:600 stop:974 length:375 start_codon:yes stop_codon:yes gene_type:complete